MTFSQEITLQLSKNTFVLYKETRLSNKDSPVSFFLSFFMDEKPPLMVVSLYTDCPSLEDFLFCSESMLRIAPKMETAEYPSNKTPGIINSNAAPALEFA